MKILIVDDNADDRKIMRCNLEHHDCHVLEAIDGLAALDMVVLNRPDIIISDALMPRMDGFQFLRAIKTDEALKSIPFVFYSATYTGAEEAELAISLGAEAFIIKPKDPIEFWDELNGIIEGCSIRDTNALRAEIIEKDHDYLLKYSNIVANKLEEKVKELELALAERKQTDQELRKSEKKYRAIFENTQDVFYQVDLDGIITEISPSITRHSGYSRDELIGKPIVNYYFYPEDRAKLLGEIQKKGEVTDFEVRLKTKDGRLVHTSVNAHLLFDNTGKPVGMEGSLRDITERKRMEDEIIQAKNEWVETFDTINEAITIHDLDFNIIRANRAAEELLKVSNQTIISRKCYQSFHCSDCPSTGCPGEQAIRTGKPAAMEQFEPHLGKYLEVRTIPKFDNGGQIIGLVHVVRDITDRKKAEEEHRSLQDQLRQAQKMEAIGTLAGGIAHDFNNILSVIIGYSGLMAMKMSADDPLMPHLRMISEAGERAKHLTDSLLVFSRKQTPKLSQVGINGVIEGMKKMTLRIIGEHIESRVRLSDEEMIVMGDSGLLEQVMLNLATNARDAMPGGGILTVETARMQMDDDFIHLHGFGEPGPYALITVSDNGQGMDRETREKIFEPFFTTKEVGRGTGLGLAIVYGIVKQLKGFINCYSEPGQGTTFRIYLPLAEAIETRAELKNMTEVQGGGETILIADDDQHVRSLTRELIEHFGYTVIEAVDGADAVRQFDKNRGKIDLLVLDVIMPKKNGREVLDEIRLQQPNVKAIFLSGYSADIVSDKGSSGAGADLLLKPVIPHLLMQRIREVLDS